ncbi:hypothetical protein ACVBEF_06055 [Glaciimonas sp. GG7]
MNIKHISAGLVLLAIVGIASASTFAPTVNGDNVVIAQPATDQGVNTSGDAYPVTVALPSTLTRQQVQADFREANRRSANRFSYAELVFLR